jgi:hypothetical protein
VNIGSAVARRGKKSLSDRTGQRESNASVAVACAFTSTTEGAYVPDTPEGRHYVSRGVEVRITAESDNDEVGLQLNGMPVDVIYIDGQYHSQLANQFTGFPTIDSLVESLLQTQGRTWTLRGGAGGGTHPHGGNGGHGHHHGHEGGGVR